MLSESLTVLAANEYGMTNVSSHSDVKRAATFSAGFGMISGTLDGRIADVPVCSLVFNGCFSTAFPGNCGFDNRIAPGGSWEGTDCGGMTNSVFTWNSAFTIGAFTLGSGPCAGQSASAPIASGNCGEACAFEFTYPNCAS